MRKHGQILGLLAFGLCLAFDRLTSAAPPMTHYRIEVDAYVRDEQSLCKQAWEIALRRFGPGVAEGVTMQAGKFDAARCLAVIYQTTDVGEEIVSAGIEVKEVSK